MFEAADMTSFFWQPVLKAVGGSQLELASLQARQAQAVMHWAHQILQPASPMDLLDANTRLWQTTIEHCAETMPYFAAAVGSAAQSVAPIVLPAPPKRSHDKLILIDRSHETEDALERKVA
jgi:hypothetical protein